MMVTVHQPGSVPSRMKLARAEPGPFPRRNTGDLSARRERGDEADRGYRLGRARVPARQLIAAERLRMMQRPAVFILSVLALLPCAASVLGQANSPGGGRPEAADAASAPQGEADARAVRDAIVRGLRFLSRRQLPSGAIGERYPVATTSLAGLAILGAGHRYHGGEFGPMLHGTLQYLKLASRAGNGYASDPKSKMHGHCYAVLFLTQVYGELPAAEQAEVGRMVRDGLEVIRRSQTTDGGWFYEPKDTGEDEASITICALQALRAANEAGFSVPKRVVDQAAKYVGNCQNPDGAFRYSFRGPDRHPSYALTVAAISTLHAAGVYESPEIRRGLDYARRAFDATGGDPVRAAEKEFFAYANFYAAQAFYQAGGDLWAAWHPSARRYYLRRQIAPGESLEGSWTDDHGPELGTAMALLILEVPLNYLPIYQR